MPDTSKSNLKPNAALFLDRDGTVNIDTGYIDSPEKLQLIPGAAEAIARVNQAGVPVIIVTNQSGIARGMYTEQTLKEIHHRMDELLQEADAHVDAYYHCPHHTEGIVPAYQQACKCRKPEPGMFLTAAAEMNIDLSKSVMIGDKRSDLEAGLNAGCAAILVRTGNGVKTERALDSSLKSNISVENSLVNAIENWLK
ncbi:MAG: D-glycero-beta-D-manno-heptose-1,7-bisphosphate 7-phosphatase [Blastopirellula sp.]|nr:MAG: D-glycero-beta-D-manno-heptose-1,7-bisphosphate 7-phosphatase [Blastopirellula sp.]